MGKEIRTSETDINSAEGSNHKEINNKNSTPKCGELEDDNSHASRKSNLSAASNSNSSNNNKRSNSKSASAEQNNKSFTHFESEDENSQHSRKSNISSSSNTNSKSGRAGNSTSTDTPHKQEKENRNSTANSKKLANQQKPEEQKFRVTTTNTEFKLRIVPLEKLLEKPPVVKKIKPDTPPPASKQKQEKPQQKRLPERKNRKNYSIIELSDSEEEEEGSEPEPELETQSVAVDKKQVSKDLIISTKRNGTTPKDDTSCNKEAGIQRAETQQNNNSKKKNNNTSSNQLSNKTFKLKRCVVKLKRTRLPTAVVDAVAATSATKEKEKRQTHKMSTAGTVAVDKPSGSKTRIRDKRISSDSEHSDWEMQEQEAVASSADDDSEFEVKKAAVAAEQAAEEDAASDSEDKVKPRKGKTKTKAKKQQSEPEDSDAIKSSDSEIMPVRKKRVFNKRKHSSDNDSDFEPKEKVKKRKRGRVKRRSSDSDDDDDDDDEKNKNKRKHIRKIIKTQDLDISTKTAGKEEEERRKRIEERQKLYNQIYEKPENAEVTELVLDFDEETKEPLLQVDKGLLKKLKPHQVTGVKFMWDACFETLQEAEENPGSGCILAHCMGLGKTLQIVALSHTLLTNFRRTGVQRVLVISPLSTLTNWAREFHQWMAFTRKRNIEVYDMSKFRDKPTRIFKLNEWYEEGGVCIMGYDMYRILANEKAKGLRKKQRETLQNTLVDPGPDLVICDEGHLLKNEKTSISKAVTRIRTKRRIVLTGTPLQNNLKEYYCMIQFIKPNLLGTYKEYLNRFVNPITNGQYTDSTERDIRLMKHRSHILHKLLEGCIQRRDYSVLAPYLPPKHEYVVYTLLSVQQELLYDYYMTTQRDISSSDLTGRGARLFQDFQDLRRIWTHPMSLRVNSDAVIRKRLMADSDSIDDFIDDDEDDDEASVGSTSDGGSVASSKSFASGGGQRNAGRSAKATRNNKPAEDSVVEVQPDSADDPSEWWKRFVADKELNNVNHSPKLKILMRLLQQCEAIGDKLLVFSQSLQSLDVIEHFLSLIDSKTKGHEIEADVGDFKGVWSPGKDYFRLDGSCSVESREAMCKQFNNVSNLRARLFLISTRAGGLGINLVAANRVVIFDVSWNPSHDTQSIFRVYRFGQNKPCYIYRLIAMGTMEQKVYERQVAKQATAKRVIDEQQISRHYNQSDLQELYTYELKPSTEREVPILPKDRLFAELLSEEDRLIFKYHEHDSLLENEESENLSEAERKAAWSEYEAEKTRSVQTAQYMAYDRGAFGTQFGNAAGSVTSNKIFGFRSDVLLQLLNMKVSKDHPELTQNQITQMVPSYLQRLYDDMNNGDPTMYKDLLLLHATLAHPSGLYMNPLLYANQDPGAAGYFQAAAAGQPPGMPLQPGVLSMPMQPGVLPLSMPADGIVQQAPIAAAPVPGFDPNEVYEID